MFFCALPVGKSELIDRQYRTDEAADFNRAGSRCRERQSFPENA
jgi:hypothetical protein